MKLTHRKPAVLQHRPIDQNIIVWVDCCDGHIAKHRAIIPIYEFGFETFATDEAYGA